MKVRPYSTRSKPPAECGLPCSVLSWHAHAPRCTMHLPSHLSRPPCPSQFAGENVEIRWPDAAERQRLGRLLNDFPGVIGYIDGTCDRIAPPRRPLWQLICQRPPCPRCRQAPLLPPLLLLPAWTWLPPASAPPCAWCSSGAACATLRPRLIRRLHTAEHRVDHATTQ